MSAPANLPVIDVSPLLSRSDQRARARVGDEIGRACRAHGFFQAVGHGVSAASMTDLREFARAFFALPLERKLAIRMALGGRAWRGYFPIGGELTSGRPDLKEGLYFGTELPPSDPRVKAGLPLHGANLFPAEVPRLREAVLEFMGATTHAAHAILEGIALALGIDERYFERHYTAEPTILFRIFRYPPSPPEADGFGVGEHTDYGLLTLLAQDGVGGLEVKSHDGWIDVAPIEGAFVCNLGDMLDRLTGGEFRSTPHRVRNRSAVERFSFPLFFDPAFEAEIVPLPRRAGLVRDDAHERWDRSSVHEFRGTYGAYLLGKVAKVFPELASESLGDGDRPGAP